MKRTLSAALAVIILSLAPAASTYAQQAKPDSTIVSADASSHDPKSAAYDAAIKDLKRIDGPFPLYLRKKEVLLEIPESRLNQPFLIQAAFNTGLDTAFLSAGMSIGGDAIDAYKWVRSDDVVSLVRPNLTYRWNKNDPFSVGAERAFPEAILGGFRVEQSDPVRHLLLVNVTTLFFGDLFELPQMVAGTLGGPYMIDRERSGVDSAKGFPDSTTVSMKLHFVSPRGAEPNPLAALLGFAGSNTLEDDRSAPVKVTYTMWYRQDDGYVPRVADPRIGYFTDDFFTLDKYLSADRNEHFINRFNIRKKDPKAAVSEPVKPIVWTIDPSIPEEYRGAVKDGILRWNKAFEALGYKNAVQVEDAPTDGTYDHADGRRNVIRMIVGPSCPFAAISLPRTDPYTGEILNASITIDGNVIRDLFEEHKQTLMSATDAMRTRASKVLLRMPDETEPVDQFVFENDRDRASGQIAQSMAKYGWKQHECDYADELAQEAGVNWYAIEAAGSNHLAREEYVKKFLSECVSHEVGHCLGLRHNFAGSTNLTTAQLADDELTSEQGITASVMDYTPPNAQAVLKGHGNFFSPTLGVYDLWAIKYGYSDFGASNPTAEKPQLSAIARESGRPGHAYMTDEDADSFNPYAVRFDLSKDPLQYCGKELLALRKARAYAIQNLPAAGQSYRVRTEAVLSTIIRSFSEGRIAARFVGGMVANRNFRGDDFEKPTLAPVPADQQRTAMSLLSREFLSPTSFDLPSSVLSSLTFGDESPTWTAPLRDLIGANQQALAALVMSARTTDRIAENEYKLGGKDAYTLEEHYSLLLGAVFREVGAGKPISPLRRDLQRFVLSGLLLQAGAPEGAVSDDVRLIANDSLHRLEMRFQDAAKAKKLDPLTRVYLREGVYYIQRYMARLSTTR
jgi:hypothetical protein